METPDHPIVQNLERTGYPDGKEPVFPICPVCGEECDTMYKDRYGALLNRGTPSDLGRLSDCLRNPSAEGISMRG